jgi:2-polyprenyl-3-methyl-5-hydroxy-6-metoxy-1,4-benzoquinol methylase
MPSPIKLPLLNLPRLAGITERWRSHRERSALLGRSADDIFSDYFHRNTWGSAESRSGRGSDRVQTHAVIEALPSLLRELGVQRMLDVPCGDFHWMSQVDLRCIDYIGGDIVQALVDENKLRHQRDGVAFRRLDVLQDALPQVDMVLCRDCLVHLSFADIRRALRQMVTSQSTWLLTTAFTARDSNDDIATGQWRPLNLRAAPFHLPEPVRVIDEHCTEGGGQYSDKTLALWRIADLPAAMSTWN